jgi:hypothetical protein
MRRALTASKPRSFALGRGLFAAAALAAVTLGAVLRAEAEPAQAGSAEDVLAKIEANDVDKALVTEPAARARSALERARRMRLAGDEAHARQADAVAREWALVAEALVRAAKEEARAAAARKAALDAGTEAERERALLEQSIARAGRLQAELRKAQAETDAGPAAAPPTAAAGAVDGGAKRPVTADGGAGK